MNIFSFSDKDGRLKYFLTNIACSVFVLFPLEAAVSHKASLVIVLALVLLALFLYISSGVRRCNDIGISGLLLFAYIVPVVNIAVGAYLTFAPSGSGADKRIAGYCGGAVAAIFAIGVIASMVSTKQDDAPLPTVSQAVQKPEIDFSYEPPASQPHPSVAFQQKEPSPVVFPPPNFDAGRQAELARQADDERRRRNREEEKERERFYAKQYAERDVAKCNVGSVMTDAEIQACSRR